MKSARQSSYIVLGYEICTVIWKYGYCILVVDLELFYKIKKVEKSS